MVVAEEEAQTRVESPLPPGEVYNQILSLMVRDVLYWADRIPYLTRRPRIEDQQLDEILAVYGEKRQNRVNHDLVVELTHGVTNFYPTLVYAHGIRPAVLSEIVHSGEGSVSETRHQARNAILLEGIARYPSQEDRNFAISSLQSSPTGEKFLRAQIRRDRKKDPIKPSWSHLRGDRALVHGAREYYRLLTA